MDEWGSAVEREGLDEMAINELTIRCKRDKPPNSLLHTPPPNRQYTVDVLIVSSCDVTSVRWIFSTVFVPLEAAAPSKFKGF